MHGFFVLSVLWFLITNGMVHGSLTEVPIKNIQNISRGNEQRLPASYKYYHLEYKRGDEIT